MSSLKFHLTEPDPIFARFECPTPHCNEIVEGQIEPAFYDTSGENETDMHGYSITDIECPACKTIHPLQSTAMGNGLFGIVVGYAGTEVDYSK